MIDVAFAASFIVVGWGVLCVLAYLLNPPREEDVTTSGTFLVGGERVGRWRSARHHAVALLIAAWLFFLPLLLWPASRRLPFVGGLLLAAGFSASLVVAWRVVRRGARWRASLFLAQAVVQLSVLLLVAGLATSDRMAPSTIASLKTRLAVRGVGVAWQSWRAASSGFSGGTGGDEVGARSVVEANEWPLLDSREVAAVLVPAFIAELPDTDGWGRPIEYRGWISADAGHEPSLMVRSAGADAALSARYELGRESGDIVWIAGWPVVVAD